MQRRSMRRLVFLAGIGIVGAVSAATARSFNFDADLHAPNGWNANATGGRPADWRIVRDARAASAPHVLSIVRIADASRANFNLYWSPGIRFHNGVIAVDIRADGGQVDRGGGLIWRVRDANNYYIARYNPLERNLRLYYVKDGVRQLLADASGLSVGSGEWFELKVAHHGERIRVSLNGRKLIDTTDATFGDAGGIGLWAKADAASSFDNLAVRHDGVR